MAFQLDIGRISETDTKYIVNPMKMYRDRERVKNMVVSVRADQHRHIRVLYFDGREDHTFTGRSSTKKEEHVAVVVKPDSEYFTHYAPDTSGAIHQRHLTEIAIDDAADVPLLGYDGTAVVIGRKGGTYRLSELCQDLPRAVQWFICQLHANKPFWRLMFNELGLNHQPQIFFRTAWPGR